MLPSLFSFMYKHLACFEATQTINSQKIRESLFDPSIPKKRKEKAWLHLCCSGCSLFLSKELFIAQSKQRVRTENGSSAKPYHRPHCHSSHSIVQKQRKSWFITAWITFTSYYYCHLWAFSTCRGHKLFIRYHDTHKNSSYFSYIFWLS